MSEKAPLLLDGKDPVKLFERDFDALKGLVGRERIEAKRRYLIDHPSSDDVLVSAQKGSLATVIILLEQGSEDIQHKAQILSIACKSAVLKTNEHLIEQYPADSEDDETQKNREDLQGYTEALEYSSTQFHEVSETLKGNQIK